MTRMQAGSEVATFDLDVVRRFAGLVVDDLFAARGEPLDGEIREPAYDAEIEGGNICLRASSSHPLPCGGDHGRWSLLDSRLRPALSYPRAVARTSLSGPHGLNLS